MFILRMKLLRHPLSGFIFLLIFQSSIIKAIANGKIPPSMGPGYVPSKNTGAIPQEIALRSLTRSHLWGAWGTTQPTKRDTTSKHSTTYE